MRSYCCRFVWRLGVRAGILILAVGAVFMVTSPGAAMAISNAPAMGGLDCNGDSPIQRPIHPSLSCADVRGFGSVWNANTWDGRFYDNGVYIGHDEPDMTFLSDQSGSGGDVTWTERIPYDPSAYPTATNPGHDVNHWFELSVAPWFSMAICDPNSYPQTPCQPQSDSNAPAPDCLGVNPCTSGYGGGSAFMEMQFYPPGQPPLVDSTSCDHSHWCAALNIDSLECTYGFADCNPDCEEPVNFGLIQRDGIPAGPPAPQDMNLATWTPNSETLLMNPGDVIRVHMFDAPVPGGGGQRAFEVVIQDLTTHQTGWMQASAANGFMNTSMTDCSGKPFNFQPEYNTARRDNIVPWAALETNISTEFETGHWESCTSLSQPQPYQFNDNVITDPFNGTVLDVMYNQCAGPYEASAPGQDGGTNPETGDAACYPRGDTHGVFHTAPDEATGCEDNIYQNGDLDFDGNPYWPDWPLSVNPTRTFPGSFVDLPPATGQGQQYPQFFIQTDVALSESSCTASGAGCGVPPPTAPGHFYPYWSRTTNGADMSAVSDPSTGAGCAIEFGNVHRGVQDFGRDAQYGTNQTPTLGYPEYIGPIMQNSCAGRQARDTVRR